MFPFAWTVNILSITTALPLDFPFQLFFFLHREQWKARQGLVHRGWEGGKRSRDHHSAMKNTDTWTEIARGHLGNGTSLQGEGGMKSSCVPTYKAIRHLLSNNPQLLTTTTLLWYFSKECHPHSPVQEPISQFIFSNPTKVRVDNQGRAGPCAPCQAWELCPIPVGASSSCAGQLCPIPAELNDSGAPENPSPLFQCREVTGNICKQYICTLPMVSKSKGC